MARMFTAETKLQGLALLSFGAHACQPGSLLGYEERPERREAVKDGNPDERW